MTAKDVKHDLCGIVRVYWSLLLGNIVEWYEFAVFGYLERYLEQKFFRGSAIAAWLGFGVTFFARPIGGAMFGVIGDRFGRSVAVNLSIIGMLVGTVGQGCLPTYASGSDVLGTIGLVILIAFRLLQGMSAAGEISTISTYITEVGNPNSIGRAISLISITANAGFLFAKAVVFTLDSVLGHEALENWGWRVPFILSLVPGLTAIWGRRGVPESAAFLAEVEKQASEMPEGEDSTEDTDREGSLREQSLRTGASRPVGAVFADHAGNIVIGMLGVAASAVVQYGGFVWINTYLAKQGMEPSGTMLASLTARTLMIVMALPVGWLTDKKGVAWVLFAGSTSLAVFAIPLFSALAADPTNVPRVVGIVGVGFGLIGSLSLTTFFYFVVELFPTAVRSSAVGLSYNLGFSLFGGLAPFAMRASLGFSPHGPGIMLAASGLLTSVTIVCALILRRRGRVTLTYVRKKPYFASPQICGVISDARVKEANSSGSTSEGSSSAQESGAESSDSS